MSKNVFLAIEGEGFFIVKELNSGERYYTRNSNFILNENDYLVTHCGKFLLDYNEKPLLWKSTNCLKRIKTVIIKDTKSLNRVKNGLYSAFEELECINNSEIVQLSTETNNTVLADVFIELLKNQNEVARSSKVITPLNDDYFR